MVSARAATGTADGPAKEQTLDNKWAFNGMPKVDPDGLDDSQGGDGMDNQSAQNNKNSDEDDAYVRQVHDNVLKALKEGNTTLLEQYLNSKWEHFERMLQELNTGRNILHRLINSASEGEIKTKIASMFAAEIAYVVPDLIKHRSTQDGDQNVLELAANSQNCLEIIQAIYEHGILLEVTESPQAQPATENIPEETRIIERKGKIFQYYADFQWHSMIKNDSDTFLHKAIRANRNDYAEYFLSIMRDMNDYKAVLQHRGQSGRTPLHDAVDPEFCSSRRVQLVKEMISLYPGALAMDSATLSGSDSATQYEVNRKVQKTYAPFKYFEESVAKSTKPSSGPDSLQSRVSDPRQQTIRRRGGAMIQVGRPPISKTPSAQKSPVLRDEAAIKQMRQLLRLQCMEHHGKNRATLTNLIGKPGEIHLNLASRKVVTLQFLNWLAKRPFEPLLQYVYIPNLETEEIVPDREIAEQSWWKGSSRKDYFHIFHWLKHTKKVDRILSITVDDHPTNCHSDEIIEHAVKEFNIETWNWVKVDMCSETIKAAAEKLKTIRIMTPKSIESPDRFLELQEKFQTDLTTSWNGMGRTASVPKAEFPPADGKRSIKELSDKKKEEKDLQQKWITAIDEVTMKLKLYLNNRKEGGLCKDEEVRLAIIDDGFFPERNDMDKYVVDHEAFGEDDGDYSEWQAAYQSTYGHGHLMACIIKRVCPRVKLYIAKLDEVWRDGRSQITTTSAAKAIRWAVDRKVDIISMSWTIENPEEAAKTQLEGAVQAALKDGILLFCASDDQGDLNNMPYPARIDKRIFWIGPATALGRPTESSQTDVMFLAPGTEENPLGNKDFGKPRVGSSIATARCAGLAALILQFILLAPANNRRSHIREKHMREMFKRLTKDKTGEPNGNHKYLRVWGVFEEARLNMALGEDFDFIKWVADIFLKFVEVDDATRVRTHNPSLD